MKNIVVGLTGPSGAGKSTVCGILAGKGFVIADCDKISHSLDGDPLYIKEIENVFGEGTVKNGVICRPELAKIVFSSEERRKKLESIAHPIIIKRVNEIIKEALDGKKDVVIDAPLLFESGCDGLCDVTVGVIADENLRIGRAAARDRATPESIKARMKVQKVNTFYEERCDYILKNNGDTDSLKAETDRLLFFLGTKKVKHKDGK